MRKLDFYLIMSWCDNLIKWNSAMNISYHDWQSFCIVVLFDLDQMILPKLSPVECICRDLQSCVTLWKGSAQRISMKEITPMGWHWGCMFAPTHNLTHLPMDKMAAISQRTFLNTFPWMKSFVFWLKFHWSLFLRVQLTMSQHWFT